MKSVTSLLAGAALVAMAGSATAGEPITLGDASLDQVTAGVELAAAYGISATLGDVFSETATYVETLTFPGYASAESETAGIAASLVFGAASASYSTAAAELD